jgi:di/tripeptidase
LDVKVAEVEAGSLRNAIPREAWATVAVDKSKEQAFKDFVKKYEQTVKNEYKTSDPDLKIVLETTGAPAKVMDDKASGSIYQRHSCRAQWRDQNEQRYGRVGRNIYQPCSGNS